jgi:hypothetical protein
MGALRDQGKYEHAENVSANIRAEGVGAGRRGS